MAFDCQNYRVVPTGRTVTATDADGQTFVIHEVRVCGILCHSDGAVVVDYSDDAQGVLFPQALASLSSTEAVATSAEHGAEYLVRKAMADPVNPLGL